MLQRKFATLAVLMLLASAKVAHADDMDLLIVGEPEIVEVPDLQDFRFGASDFDPQATVEDAVPGTADFLNPVDDVVDALGVTLDKIVNLGTKIWNLVEKGRPAVDVQLGNASALPQGVNGWQNLEGWANPESRSYEVTYRNGYNIPVVTFGYRVLYTYGGSFQGKGRYLSRITVIPSRVDVGFAYNFSASSEIPNVVNVGTTESPIAGAEILVKWRVKTVLQDRQSSTSYFVRGDGEFKDLN